MRWNRKGYFAGLLILIAGLTAFSGEWVDGWALGQPDPTASQSSEGASPSEAPPDNAVEMTDIHDIKPPEALGFNPAYGVYGLLALLLAALFIAIWRYWKKRRKYIKTDEIELSLPPEDIALNAIEGILKHGFDDGRVFYFELSALVRNYIQARYAVNAPEMTSEELLPAIEHLPLDSEKQKDLKKLIRTADPVKFAASQAPRTKMESDIRFVRRFVMETTPVEEHV